MVTGAPLESLDDALASLVLSRDAWDERASFIDYDRLQSAARIGLRFVSVVQLSPVSEWNRQDQESQTWRRSYYDNEVEDYDRFFDDEDSELMPYDFVIQMDDEPQTALAWGIRAEVDPYEVFTNRLGETPYVWKEGYLNAGRSTAGLGLKPMFADMTLPADLPVSFIAAVDEWFDSASFTERESLYSALRPESSDTE